MKIFIDTSALVKRYIKEQGSSVVDSIFEKAETIICCDNKLNKAAEMEGATVFNPME